LPATALKQGLINGIAVPVATLAFAAIVIALRIADNAPMLPHEIAAFVFSSHIGGVSPAVALSSRSCCFWLASSAGSPDLHFPR